MSVTVLRPTGPNVGVRNPGSALYVRGDENTSGSLRFKALDASSQITRYEENTDGAWNPGTLGVQGNTIMLGEASLSAAFAYLEVEAAGELAALMPHIEFDNDGTRLVHTPILDELTEFDVATVKASEAVGTSITQHLVPNFSNILESITHEVGSIGATSQVTYTVYHGSDDTGPIKFQRNIPAAQFPADSPVTIFFGRSLGVEKGESIFLDITSDVAFSMSEDSSGHLLTVIEAYELAELGIYTENLMLDEELNTIFDEDLNPIYGNQF